MANQESPSRAPRKRWLSTPQLTAIAVCVGALATAGTISYGLFATDKVDTANDSRDSIAAPADVAANKLTKLCASAAPDVISALQAEGLCLDAAVIKEKVTEQPQNVASAPETQTVPVPVPPSPASLRGAVDAYCAVNQCRGADGKTPSTDQLMEIVAGYLTANPPQPGRPPTATEIRSAVSAYCAEDNCDGPGPTSAQMDQAIAKYCAANGNCQGPQGEQGVPGQNGQPGAEGPPGPMCPEGYTPSGRTVDHDSNPATPAETWWICVNAPSEPSTGPN